MAGCFNKVEMVFAQISLLGAKCNALRVTIRMALYKLSALLL